MSCGIGEKSSASPGMQYPHDEPTTPSVKKLSPGVPAFPTASENASEPDLTDFKITLPPKMGGLASFKRLFGSSKNETAFLEKQAESGDVAACYELGCRYEKGTSGTAQNSVLAYQYFQKASQKSHPKAQVWMAQKKEEEASKTRRKSEAQKLYAEADRLYQQAEDPLYIIATKNIDREAQELLARWYTQKSLRYQEHGRKQDSSTPTGRMRRNSLSELEEATQNLASVLFKGDIKEIEVAKKQLDRTIQSSRKNLFEIDQHLARKAAVYDPVIGGYRVME